MRKHIVISTLAVAALALGLTASLEAQRAGGRGRGPGSGGPAGDRPAVTEGQRPGPGGGGRMGRMGQPGGGREGRPGARVARPRLEAALDLTADQKTAIAALREKAREETTPLAQELRVVQRDLRQQVRGGTANDEAAKALAARAVTLRQQLADARTKTREAIAGQLTDEQRAKLSQVRARVDDRPGPRARAGRGRGPANGPGRAVPNGAPGPRGPRDGFGRV